MEKATGGAADGMVRRLSAVKVVVDLFNHELDLHKADRAISLDRERLDAMVTTLEMYIGDVEGLLRGSGGAEDRRVVETPRATASRVT
ncbi:MAG: hypothetical protein HY812_05825 [Planctomycetes bacterium]|nr:hypothetical protein [Planctomycetota bacterium]